MYDNRGKSMREEMLYLKEYEDREQKFYEDRCQMKRFMKGEVGDCQAVVEEACDRLEYNGSAMYAEVLDEGQLYRMSEQLTRQVVAPEQCQQIMPWMMMLLCNEMHVRRCRKCRRDRLFCN